MNLRGSPQEFPLAFAARQVVAADHAEDEVLGAQAPRLALRGGVKGTKAARVNATMNHLDFGIIAPQGRPRPAFRLGRIRLVNSFAQHLSHEVRHGDERIALA